jgi:hypothetical protein
MMAARLLHLPLLLLLLLLLQKIIPAQTPDQRQTVVRLLAEATAVSIAEDPASPLST